MVNFYPSIFGQAPLLGLGVFMVWWGYYAIRNKKMMWFTRTSSEGGSYETNAVWMGYFLIAYGVMWILACLRA